MFANREGVLRCSLNLAPEVLADGMPLADVIAI